MDELVPALLKLIETLLTFQELLEATDKLVMATELAAGADESEPPPQPVTNVLAAKKYNGSKNFFILDSIKYINAINSK